MNRVSTNKILSVSFISALANFSLGFCIEYTVYGVSIQAE
jgi:hypothetical protein